MIIVRKLRGPVHRDMGLSRLYGTTVTAGAPDTASVDASVQVFRSAQDPTFIARAMSDDQGAWAVERLAAKSGGYFVVAHDPSSTFEPVAAGAAMTTPMPPVAGEHA